jgi:predicted nucleic acid-binding protein
MDQRVVSFDLRDRAEIDLSHSRGGLPRLSVSTASAASAVSAADESQEVEFVHTCDSDPWVSMAFFLSLSDRARRAAEDLADLITGGQADLISDDQADLISDSQAGPDSGA